MLVVHREVYLQLIVLLYFAGEYASAWSLLDCTMELHCAEDPDLMAIFRNKLQLLLRHESS